MDRRFACHDGLQGRIAEGTDAMRLALGRRAPCLSLAAAREAATATPQRLAGRPEERQAPARATVALLDRPFPRPATGGELAVGGDDRPPAGLGAADPAAPRRPAGAGGPSWR